MAFQFCCPQGHVLQGELSQVGQVFQCPMCGSSFVIPPPETGPIATGGFFAAPGTWPAASTPGAAFPAQGPLPGMVAPQSMPMMPGSPTPTGQFSAGPFPAAAVQPFAFAPLTVEPPAPQQPPATTPPSEPAAPRFNLGFDPSARASLPFEIPGESDAPAESTGTPGFPAVGPSESFQPVPLFPATPPSAMVFPGPSTPLPAFQPVADGQDFLQAAPAVTGGDFPPSAPAEREDEAAPQSPPQVLHIRCPSGHLVKAQSDLLGKAGRCPACKRTFELRYEDSVEFQRRKAKILQREEIKTTRAWFAWALLATFLVFTGLIALVVALGSH